MDWQSISYFLFIQVNALCLHRQQFWCSKIRGHVINFSRKYIKNFQRTYFFREKRLRLHTFIVWQVKFKYVRTDLLLIQFNGRKGFNNIVTTISFTISPKYLTFSWLLIFSLQGKRHNQRHYENQKIAASNKRIQFGKKVSFVCLFFKTHFCSHLV